ncbi:MAG: ACP S-malonyltransferase, partial [bacterium]
MSDKIAFLFPGQGAQKVGMGKDLLENYPEARQIMDKAQDIIDINIEKLCLEGPEEKLNLTSITQPAIYTVSMMAYEIIKNNFNIDFDFTAGHSLGEYSALTAAGAIDFEDGLKLVRKRGKLMNEALPAGLGSMAAIIKLDKNQIEEICGEVEGVCEIANY